MLDFGAEAKRRNDRQRLVQFLKAVHEILDRLVKTGKDPTGKPLFVPELQELMDAAWTEVVPVFWDTEKAIQDASEERLGGHGLFGKQLDFKLRVVDWLSGRFQALGGAKLLKRLLQAIENLLDSIIDAAGTGGAIKEIKEAIKSSVMDEE